ncbi:MAG: ferritin [Methanobrevibacter sp.]|uniref:ferritin n=1 Tax=Methanobrevibacter sp. TaxID=66852 RepID=UPI0026DEA4B3|nr:ferritin [Methanobrevibacter sp.]MDO5847987.1 ferritin [Methanobrevibacter sp.]
MLSEKMEKALNDQMTAEFHSGYLYLSMAAYLEELDYPGFANWMKVQAKEEQDHGMKIYNYIIARGAKVTLEAIEAPQTEWDDIEAIFAHVLEHEQLVTSLINNLVDLAIEESDHATNQFLQWYVAEQVEEEENAMENLGKIKRGKNSADILFMLDAEFANRIYTSEI